MKQQLQFLIMLKQTLLILLFSTTISLFFTSCKKDYNFEKLDQDTKSIDNFFNLTGSENIHVIDIIKELKIQNSKTNFVKNLPFDCGLPIWDKTILPKSIWKLADSILPNDFILPLTKNGTNLSSILTAHKNLTGYDFTYYSMDALYNVVHKLNPSALEKMIYVYSYSLKKVFLALLFFIIYLQIYCKSIKP